MAAAGRVPAHARRDPGVGGGAAWARRGDGVGAVGAPAFARTARNRSCRGAPTKLEASGGRRPRGRGASADERAALPANSRQRENRRHRPGRGFETPSYRFEIVPTTVPSATSSGIASRLRCGSGSRPLGADVPHEVEAAIGFDYARARDVTRRVRAAARRRARRGGAVRVVSRVPDPLRPRADAREALHLIELRPAARAIRRTAPCARDAPDRGGAPERRRAR
jgi:hypothetical protein